MKILLVEDEPKLSKAIARALKNFSYTVDVVDDGKAAYDRIRLYHNDYDLVILDLMLPTIEGHIVCRRVREHNIDIPILVLTAKVDTTSKVDLLKRGADDYLAKPFSLDELDARIKALLRRPKTTLSETITVGDLEMNITERLVFRNGERINLTLKEFALLEYFMRNKDRVISRDEFLSHVWDFNYTSFFSNSVDVHIKNLRKKIKDEGSSRLIETVRGVGYRLSEPTRLPQGIVRPKAKVAAVQE
ncbi:MAG TPA: response regulator transcription factor [Candidatus Paceibacterota bacterium]